MSDVVLIVRDLGSRTAGGAILRNRALAAALASVCPSSTVLETNAIREMVGCVSQCRDCACITRDPYPWSHCERALAHVRDLLRGASAVLVSELQLHRYFRAALDSGVRNVALDMHNSEADLAAEISRATARDSDIGPLRAVERYVSGAARLVTFVSARDAARSPARDTVVIPNAVEVSAAPPAIRPATPDLVFLGHLGYPPNVEAARYLIDQVFPRVRAAVAGATLTIAGRRPDPSLPRGDGVLIHADPEDTASLLRGRVLVAPLFLGGGSRIKILEAFAACAPVITTAKGAEGLMARPSIHYLRAGAAPESYVARLRELITRPEPDVRRRTAAFDLVRDHYSWQSLHAPMRRAIEMLTGGLGCELVKESG